MSDKQVRVTELDVQRARLLQSLARRLGKTPPPSVSKVARVPLSPKPDPLTGPRTAHQARP